MTAIPIAKIGENPIVSEIFAMSKWFAFIDKDTITFEKNSLTNGNEIVNWLHGLGVYNVIAKTVDENSYKELLNNNIECYITNSNVGFLKLVEDITSENLSAYLENK